MYDTHCCTACVWGGARSTTCTAYKVIQEHVRAQTTTDRSMVVVPMYVYISVAITF